MKRRQFLLNGLGTATIISLASLKSLANPEVFGALGTGEWSPELTGMLDPEEVAAIENMTYQRSASGNLLTGVPQDLWPYEYVTKHLTEFLEEKFDAFFFVNTKDQPSGGDEFVPMQHMKMIRRKNPGDKLFVRDPNTDVIIDVTKEADVKLMAVTTGPGTQGKPFTYSGIFRFNKRRSLEPGRLYKNPEAHMSWSMYLDFVYMPEGREAGLAIHGARKHVHKAFGKYHRSEGCVALHPENARMIREFLLSEEMQSTNIPKFNREGERLPKFFYSPEGSIVMKDGRRILAQPGIKALLVIFEGYKNPRLRA